MLIATGLFTSKYVQGWDGTKVYPESHYFGKNLANRGRDMSYLTMLENWVKTSGKFPSHVKWSDLADKHGFARKISIDVSPQYSLELVQHEIEWILRINPDAHFLLLARDPSAAFVSSTDMSICSGHAGAIDPPRHCGAVGCDFRPTKLFPTSKDILAATETCTPETIPCSLFYRQLKKLTAQNQEKELKYMLGGRHAGIYGYNGHGKWRYPWVLHQQWLQVVPRHQMHVIRSDYLWDEPQLALETIASLLKLPFKIPAVKNFETKPPSQTKCKCKDSGKMFKAFHAIIDRCQLREAISCSHFYSNELMQELMTSRFPYGSPPGKTVPGMEPWHERERMQESGFRHGRPLRQPAAANCSVGRPPVIASVVEDVLAPWWP